jgi:uncharacterized protein YdcH (DUF465 family)
MASDHRQVEREDVSYDQLQAQHQSHEKRLEELNAKAWLTPDEEMEAKRLKKLKLHLKDQMEHLRRTAS